MPRRQQAPEFPSPMAYIRLRCRTEMSWFLEETYGRGRISDRAVAQSFVQQRRSSHAFDQSFKR